MLHKAVNPRRGGGGVSYHHLHHGYPPSPQNQKESDLSHLSDLSDILRGHLEDKK